MLWQGGISFGGVVSFLFADLIILPILDIYRKYYGMKMAAFLFVTFYAAMSGAGFAVELLFKALHLVPTRHAINFMAEGIRWNYTTWLDLVALVVLAVLSYFYFGKSPTEHQEHDELMPGHHGAH